jgi:hypothetical protein
MIRTAILAAVCLVVGACNTRDASDSPDFALPAAGPAAQNDAPAVPATWQVSLRGFGPLKAGMSPREASDATDGSLQAPPDADTASCTYLPWPSGPAGVSVMVVNGAVARVDVQDPLASTEAGARVGDTEDRIRELYGDRLTASPHKYTDGKYLTVVPESEADSAFRIIFEVENGRVTRFRSGVRPPVEYVEGCG